MQLFQRTTVWLAAVALCGLFVGCGPGEPISGSADPAAEAADAALAPEGLPTGDEPAAEAGSDADAAAPETTESEASSEPEAEAGEAKGEEATE